MSSSQKADMPPEEELEKARLFMADMILETTQGNEPSYQALVRALETGELDLECMKLVMGDHPTFRTTLLKEGKRRGYNLPLEDPMPEMEVGDGSDTSPLRPEEEYSLHYNPMDPFGVMEGHSFAMARIGMAQERLDAMSLFAAARERGQLGRCCEIIAELMERIVTRARTRIDKPRVAALVRVVYAELISKLAEVFSIRVTRHGEMDLLKDVLLQLHEASRAMEQEFGSRTEPWMGGKLPGCAEELLELSYARLLLWEAAGNRIMALRELTQMSRLMGETKENGMGGSETEAFRRRHLAEIRQHPLWYTRPPYPVRPNVPLSMALPGKYIKVCTSGVSPRVHNHGSFGALGRLWVFAGYDGHSRMSLEKTRDLHSLDVRTKTWSRMPMASVTRKASHLPQPCGQPLIITYQQRAYVVATGQFLCYDLTELKWRPLPRMPTALHNSTLTHTGGLVYDPESDNDPSLLVYMGSSDMSIVAPLFLFNLRLQRWRTITEQGPIVPASRERPQGWCCKDGSRFYLLFGEWNRGPNPSALGEPTAQAYDMWCFSLSTMTWRRVEMQGNYPCGRQEMALLPLGDILLVMGGYSTLVGSMVEGMNGPTATYAAYAYLADTFVFHCGSESWRIVQCDPCPDPAWRAGASLTAITHPNTTITHVYLTGGFQATRASGGKVQTFDGVYELRIPGLLPMHPPTPTPTPTPTTPQDKNNNKTQQGVGPCTSTTGTQAQAQETDEERERRAARDRKKKQRKRDNKKGTQHTNTNSNKQEGQDEEDGEGEEEEGEGEGEETRGGAAEAPQVPLEEKEEEEPSTPPLPSPVPHTSTSTDLTGAPLQAPVLQGAEALGEGEGTGSEGQGKGKDGAASEEEAVGEGGEEGEEEGGMQGVEVPLELMCPITQRLLHEPVIAMDGHTYSKAAIDDWFKQRQQQGLPMTSPLTGGPMETMLLPNRAIKRVVDDMKKRHASA